MKSESLSVMSDSLQTHGLLSPWVSLGQKTGMGSLSLLQEIFPTRDQTQISCIAGRFFTSWVTREAVYFLIELNLIRDIDIGLLPITTYLDTICVYINDQVLTSRTLFNFKDEHSHNSEILWVWFQITKIKQITQ